MQQLLAELRANRRLAVAIGLMAAAVVIFLSTGAFLEAGTAPRVVLDSVAIVCSITAVVLLARGRRRGDPDEPAGSTEGG